MTNISLDLSNKVSIQTTEIIKTVKASADKLNISIFLVGATARDLVMYHGYSLPKSSATRDIDFGVAIENWSEYDKLKNDLIEIKDFKQDQAKEHRLIEPSSKTEIDIIPFGRIESSTSKVVWEQEKSTEMNTGGFTEAFQSALTVRLTKDLVIKIVSPVGFSILKLIAWNERSLDKDATDFWLVLKNYLNIPNNEARIFEEYPAWLEDADYDFEMAGAKLLGIDIGEISSINTKQNLLDILNDDKKIERLALEIDRFKSTNEDNFSRIFELIKAAKIGIALRP